MRKIVYGYARWRARACPSAHCYSPADRAAVAPSSAVRPAAAIGAAASGGRVGGTLAVRRSARRRCPRRRLHGPLPLRHYQDYLRQRVLR